MKVYATVHPDARIMDAITEAIQWCTVKGRPDVVTSVFTFVQRDPSYCYDADWVFMFCFHDIKVVVTADADPYEVQAQWSQRVLTPCSVPEPA